MRKNCEESVRKAISNGVPIDEVDHMKQTPLYYACERGYTKIVKLLLESGACPHTNDSNETSPLWIASKQGHAGIVLMLLSEKVDPNGRARDGTTPLYQGSYHGHVKCVYHLVLYGADVNYAKNSGASPLFVAARNGHHRIVKHLLKFGADPTQTQEDLRSPLHTGLLYNRRRCVQLLLQNNANCLLQQSDIYQWTHFHFLAKNGSMKAARTLFHYLKTSKRSIDLCQGDAFGNTALHIAIFNQKLRFARYLISKGFKTNQANCFGWTYNNYLLKSQQKTEIDESIPKLYLHNLLSVNLIGYTNEEELMSVEVESYVKKLVSYVEKLNPLFRNNIIRSGSYYERTRVGLPDEFDYMINLTEIERLSKLIENDRDDSPGFARLYPLNTSEAIKKLSCYLEPGTKCISTEKIRKQFYQLLTSARAHVICKEVLSRFRHLKFEWTSGDKRCGTTIQAQWYGTQYSCLSIKIDVVPCITVHSWPKTANIKCPLEKPLFQIIPRSPKADKTYLWRISTSIAELRHFQCLTSDLRSGYLCLKILRQLNPFHCKIDQIVYTADDLITSYMFKNEFLHEVCRCPKQEQWINGSLIHRVSAILKRLHRNLLNGSIKSFYIKNYNVIDGDDYNKLRLFEIQYVQILRSQLREKVEATNNRLKHQSTIAITELISKKTKLKRRAFTNNT